MVGHKLGEFAPTRTFKGHTTKADKAASVAPAAPAERRPEGRWLMAVQAHATAKYVRTSAQKAGLVLDLIRGRDVNRALATLRFARKGVARDIEKVLRSAIANAQQKDGFGGDVERLFVARVLRQPGAVAEADPPCADGPRVPRRQAHGAPDGRGHRAAVEGRRRSRRRRRDAEASARRQAEGASRQAEEAKPRRRRRRKSAGNEEDSSEGMKD